MAFRCSVCFFCSSPFFCRFSFANDNSKWCKHEKSNSYEILMKTNAKQKFGQKKKEETRWCHANKIIFYDCVLLCVLPFTLKWSFLSFVISCCHFVTFSCCHFHYRGQFRNGTTVWWCLTKNFSSAFCLCSNEWGTIENYYVYQEQNSRREKKKAECKWIENVSWCLWRFHYLLNVIIAIIVVICMLQIQITFCEAARRVRA